MRFAEVRIAYQRRDDGWIVASIPAIRGVHSKGRTGEEARANVIDALRGRVQLPRRDDLVCCGGAVIIRRSQ
jgi:predicted RNase H-like HicB family nuclease